MDGEGRHIQLGFPLHTTGQGEAMGLLFGSLAAAAGAPGCGEEGKGCSAEQSGPDVSGACAFSLARCTSRLEPGGLD